MTDKQWFDKYTRHIIDTELYAEARASLAEDMLKELHRELKSIIESYGSITSKAKQQECEDECNECIERYISEWKDEEDKEREDYANKESDWLGRAVKAALGISLVNSLLKQKRALETPFSPTDTFDSFVETMAGDIKKAVRTPLLSSRIFGSSTSSVSESLDSAFTKIERNFKTNMQTSITGLQRNIQYQLLEDKRKLKFVYVSMLDDRTCVVCGGYSGTVYEDLSEAPAVPVHYRCRCYYIPVISSSDDIGKETYEEWFERQPDSVKYKILGPTRYNFYKSGITSIKSFSSGGKKLTLEELFEDIKIDTSKKVANALFPTEKWIKYSNGIYIAESRNRLLKNEMKKLSKEIAQAEILANNGFTVYLTPELGKGKHFDAIVNGVKTEFKTVTGKINKIGDNFLFALRQGDNVFIRYDRNTTKAAYKSLVGKAKVLLKNGLKKMPTGTVYYWNNENEVLHKWSMKDIFEIAKKLL